MTDDEPRPIGEALAAVARDLGLADPTRAAALADGWPKIVGPAVAAHSTAAGLRAGTLTVLVDSPAWATEIAALESQILVRITEEVGGGACSAIRVRVDPDAMGARHRP